MQPISRIMQVVDNIGASDNQIRCKKCGTPQRLSGNQYTTTCMKCGMHITVSKRRLEEAQKEKQEKKYTPDGKEIVFNCGICLDTGIASIPQQVEGGVYDIAYKCFCSAGDRRKEAFTKVPDELVRSLIKQREVRKGGA